MNLAAIFGVCVSLLVGSVFLAPYSSVGVEEVSHLNNNTTSVAKPESKKPKAKPNTQNTNQGLEIELEPITKESTK